MKKVLFITHQLAFNSYGGAETQILETMNKINNLDGGYYVKLFDMYNDSIEDYDIVHIFNPRSFPSESYVFSEYAKQKNVKVVTSPIYFTEPIGRTLKDICFYSSKNLILKSRKIFFKNKPLSYFDPFRFMDKLFKNSNLILPNTCEEYKLLRRYFSIPTEKFIIVPNGVDLAFKYGDPVLFFEKYGLRDYILFVGRIDKRKNVLRLIEAFTKSGIDSNLVIIGKVTDPEYYRRCRERSSNKVFFLPTFPHESEILKSAYKGARVIVLPSEYETPGLVALEGGLAGGNIVLTKIGGTKEYFKNYVWYVDPFSEKEIMDSLIDAYSKPFTNQLSNYIESNFTWEKVAEKTIDAYDKLFLK